MQAAHNGHIAPRPDEIALADRLAFDNDAGHSKLPYPGMGWDIDDDGPAPPKAAWCSSAWTLPAHREPSGFDPIRDWPEAEVRHLTGPTGGFQWP